MEKLIKILSLTSGVLLCLTILIAAAHDLLKINMLDIKIFETSMFITIFIMIITAILAIYNFLFD